MTERPLTPEQETARNVIFAGGSIREAARALGHKSPGTVARWTKVYGWHETRVPPPPPTHEERQAQVAPAAAARKARWQARRDEVADGFGDAAERAMKIASGLLAYTLRSSQEAVEATPRDGETSEAFLRRQKMMAARGDHYARQAQAAAAVAAIAVDKAQVMVGDSDPAVNTANGRPSRLEEARAAAERINRRLSLVAGG